MENTVQFAPTMITVKQRAWMRREAKRTGKSNAAVFRQLIQDKIDEGKK